MIKLEKEIKENETILYVKYTTIYSIFYQCMKCGNIIGFPIGFPIYKGKILKKVNCPECKRKIIKTINPWYE